MSREETQGIASRSDKESEILSNNCRQVKKGEGLTDGKVVVLPIGSDSDRDVTGGHGGPDLLTQNTVHRRRSK